MERLVPSLEKGKGEWGKAQVIRDTISALTFVPAEGRKRHRTDILQIIGSDPPTHMKTFILNSTPGVEFPDHLLEIIPVEMGINLGGGDGFMSQHFLDGPQIGTTFDQMGSK